MTDTEGFRRPVWLALWGGMICQVYVERHALHHRAVV